MRSGTSLPVESSIIASSILVVEDPSVMIGSPSTLLGVEKSDTSSVVKIPSVGIESLVMETGSKVSGSSVVDKGSSVISSVGSAVVGSSVAAIVVGGAVVGHGGGVGIVGQLDVATIKL